ncbi:hypothetical protein N7G274_008788 [Stereocaulon virgatum]|uniref:DUF1770-domain-containing protein n=1 Tax=Stereocaulon virgatum TaxID=373712 RepID=A0ABR4A0Z6_9LECA
MSSAVANIASTIQSASIKHHPDPAYDLNPSTAASEKRPVSPQSVSSSEASIPEYVLKPIPRRSNLPPLPDLRFEQSYLASLDGAETYWKIAWITGRDQVLLPLVQGTLWTLALSGWRYWNKGATFSGQSLGARVRRWWWGVNNWKFEESAGIGTGAGAGAGSRSAGVLKDEKFAEHIGDYYSTQFGSGARD